MAVTSEVEKRAAGKVVTASANGAGDPGKGQVERDRLRMMMLIRRFEERTYQEFTKPGQKIGGVFPLSNRAGGDAGGGAAVFPEGGGGLGHGDLCPAHLLGLGWSPAGAVA